ncbi:12284_t:CDS:2 [Funneliformis mosseae]|uniref:Elongation of fatty acids protein n=1 Tax=Funneliformis mosseae TaxID=27381 RepID=A0A9N8W7N7_FUNMO|nr:12284_t:CDS:2 [Funneliformis mosseae]
MEQLFSRNSTTPPSKGIPFPEYYPNVMDYRFPLTIASLYIISVSLFNPRSNAVSRIVAKQKGLKIKNTQSSPLMTAFIFLHNLALCVFSIITFINMGRAFFMNFVKHSDSFTDAYCDRDSSLWNNSLGYWGYLFYLSKFYEVIDTVIILFKGRRSSFLQTYHHAGAMITMWSGMNFKAPPIWIFVVFNSFIHSIMYAYYAATCIGFSPPGKQYLTTMQIIQFLIGTPLAISYLFVDDCLRTDTAVYATYINVCYLLPLTALFINFAAKTYGSKRKNVKKVQ